MTDQSDAHAPEEEAEAQEAAPDEDVSDEENAVEDEEEAEYEAGEEDENDAAAEAGEGSGALDPDGLNVPLVFNLGHGRVSIGDLRGLAPGYVISLESDPGAEVAIIASGQEIGRGEVVQIADRLGVRIVSLKGGSDA